MRRFVFLFLLILTVVTVARAEGGSLKGKVSDNVGKAVSGAQVRAERDGAEPVTTTTNSKGEFNFTNLPAGEYLVGVDAEGYKSVEILKKQKVEAGKTTKLSGEVVLIKQLGGALIRGAVFTERGFSLPGATVTIERVDSKEEKQRKTTNTAGEFAFRLSEKGGQFRITATAQGYEAATQTVELQSGESRSIAISLKAK